MIVQNTTIQPQYTLYTDGGSRGNPGSSACACFIFANDKLYSFDSKYLGTSTNNNAEYEGLLLGVKLALKNGIENLQIFMDSELVVKQISGVYKISDENLKSKAMMIQKELKKFASYKINHVLRAENKFADKLVNIVLDAFEK